jgi:hypothetical protein
MKPPTMSSTVRTINCILNGPGDWDEWFDTIQTAVKVVDIWPLINPDTRKDLRPALIEPIYPVPNDVKTAAQQLKELEAVEQEELQVRRRFWSQQHAKWERQKEALSQMELRIRESIAKSHLSYTRKCEGPYEILVKLRDCFKLLDDTQKEETIAKYLQLQKPPKN